MDMRIESIADRILCHRRLLQLLIVISTIGVFLDRWALPQQVSKGMGGLVITLALVLVLCTSLSLDLFAYFFESKAGALRHGGRVAFYFPWLRSLALILLVVIAILPLIILGHTVSELFA